MEVSFEHEKKIFLVLILLIVAILVCCSDRKVLRANEKGRLGVEEPEISILQTPTNISKSTTMKW